MVRKGGFYMAMQHDQIGNPYHITNRAQRDKEIKEEKTLNHVYSVLEQLLLEMKAIHEHIESLDSKAE